MNPEMLLRMLGIDPKDMPSAGDISTTFATLKTVPDRLSAIEERLNALLDHFGMAGLAGALTEKEDENV